MKGRRIALALLFGVVVSVMGTSQLYSQSGKIGDESYFRKIKEDEAAGVLPSYTASKLYRMHEENALGYELQFRNTVFKLWGTVVDVRIAKSYESAAAYIIELASFPYSAKNLGSGYSDNIKIGYPKNISQEKLKEISGLKKGQDIEAIVFGTFADSRDDNIYPYVHIFYYTKNGVAMTE